MIRFVKDTPRGQIGNIQLEFITFHIPCTCYDPHFPFYHLKKPRKRKTAFVAYLFALDMDYLRIDQHMPLMFAIFSGNIHHKKPLRKADLRSREANTTGFFHRFKHIRDQHLEIAVELVVADRLSDDKQNRIRIMNDL